MCWKWQKAPMIGMVQGSHMKIKMSHGSTMNALNELHQHVKSCKVNHRNNVV